MRCEFCGSDNLVAGYYGEHECCVSVEQTKGNVGYIWKIVDQEKRQIPDSHDIQCRECGRTFKNPYRN